MEEPREKGQLWARTRLTDCLFTADRVLVIEHTHDSTRKESPIEQLLYWSRVAVPAIFNFLHFRKCRTAVLYLGKKKVRMHGAFVKEGIEGADDLKIRLLRFLINDLWPSVKVDVPAESRPAEGAAGGRLMANSDIEAFLSVKEATEGMHYVKVILRSVRNKIFFDPLVPAREGDRWESRCLHIRLLDNLESKRAIESYSDYISKFREACVFSTQSIAQSELEPMDLIECRFHDAERGFFLSSHEGDIHKNAQSVLGRTHYNLCDLLMRPESTILDYKSYFADPITELLKKSVPFLCGFLNSGYRRGKLVVGVFEMPRKELSPTLLKEFADQRTTSSAGDIVQHNDIVENVVTGLRVSPSDAELLQVELTKQLAQCVPPIPPHFVKLDLLEVKWTSKVITSPKVLVFYLPQGKGTECPSDKRRWEDAFRQRTNLSVRSLISHDMMMCPIEVADYYPLQNMVNGDRKDEKVSLKETRFIQCYVVVPRKPNERPVTPQPQREKSSKRVRGEWESDLVSRLDKISPEGSRLDVRYALLSFEEPIAFPPLSVIELSVDAHRKSTTQLDSWEYDGYYFSGWPSIPIWTLHPDSVGSGDRQVSLSRRSMCVFPTEPVMVASPSDSESLDVVIEPQVRKVDDFVVGVPRSYNTFVDPVTTIEQLKDTKRHSARFHDKALLRICEFLQGSAAVKVTNIFSAQDVRNLRQVCQRFNFIICQQYGIDFVLPLDRSHGGRLHALASAVSPFQSIRRLQGSFRVQHVPLLPLVLAWVFERVGSLLNPFPYRGASFIHQGERLHPKLIPLYFLDSDSDEFSPMSSPVSKQFKTAVVLDLADGYIKHVVREGDAAGRWRSLIVSAVVGVGLKRSQYCSKYAEYFRTQCNSPTSPGPRSFIDANENIVALSSTRLGRRTHHDTTPTRHNTPKSYATHWSHMSRTQSGRDLLRWPSSNSEDGTERIMIAEPSDPECAMTQAPSTAFMFYPQMAMPPMVKPLCEFVFITKASSHPAQSLMPWTLFDLLEWLQQCEQHPSIKLIEPSMMQFGLFVDPIFDICTFHKDYLFENSSMQTLTPCSKSTCLINSLLDQWNR